MSTLYLVRTLRTSGRTLGLLALLAGVVRCSGDHPGQIDTLQRFASALRSHRPRTACGALLPRLQDEINCDSVIVPLLHYSPGFPGSAVRRRGHASGWRLSSVVTVPVRYEGPGGAGNLDVTMHQLNGEWRIALILPVP